MSSLVIRTIIGRDICLNRTLLHIVRVTSGNVFVSVDNAVSVSSEDNFIFQAQIQWFIILELESARGDALGVIKYEC